ncbi:class I SAM-dependent methyltransferase [Clostridium sp.]|uniref:class I SAM-dependent methyltransferase n=1 Tax=Clostridium sp. TaxID=1506 RepID=UPI003464E1CE
MYSYVGDLSKLTHNIIKTYCRDFQLAVDCTLGNGHDCDFLRENFKKVYAFEIQEHIANKYLENNYDNVEVIINSHKYIKDYIKEEADCIMYNLGFLPGGDKNITTLYESSLYSISKSLDIIKPGGFITVAVYPGHEQGKNEKDGLYEFFKTLPKNKFGVMEHNFFNRSPKSPSLIVIEKNFI